eukprot:190456_1
MYPSGNHGNQYNQSNGNYGYQSQPMDHSYNYNQTQLTQVTQPPSYAVNHSASPMSNTFTDNRYLPTDPYHAVPNSVHCNPNQAIEPPPSYQHPSHNPCMSHNMPQGSNSIVCPDHCNCNCQQQSHPSVVDMSHCSFGMKSMNISTSSQPMASTTTNPTNTMQNNGFHPTFNGNSDPCTMPMNNTCLNMSNTNATWNNMNRMTYTSPRGDHGHGMNHHMKNMNNANNTNSTAFQRDMNTKYNPYDYAQRTMTPANDVFDCNQCIVPSIPFIKRPSSMPSSASSSTISTPINTPTELEPYNAVGCYNNIRYNDVKHTAVMSTTPCKQTVSPHQIAIKSTKEDVTKKHVCSECGKRFRYLSLLDRHITSHSDEKPYLCDHPGCTKRFQHKYYLNQHKRRTHDAIKKHKCPQCEKAFVEKCNLKIHLRKHTGEKPYQCYICLRRFSVKTNLDAHMRIHNGDKPFKCELCGKCFARKAYLTQHHRTHTGEKPFECEYCGKRCSQVGDLKKHIRIHTGEKPYECEICKKKFRYSSHLKSHTRKLHTKSETLAPLYC